MFSLADREPPCQGPMPWLTDPEHIASSNIIAASPISTLIHRSRRPTQMSQASQPGLDNLPEELILQVAEHLSDIQAFLNLGSTNHKFHRVLGQTALRARWFSLHAQQSRSSIRTANRLGVPLSGRFMVMHLASLFPLARIPRASGQSRATRFSRSEIDELMVFAMKEELPQFLRNLVQIPRPAGTTSVDFVLATPPRHSSNEPNAVRTNDAIELNPSRARALDESSLRLWKRNGRPSFRELRGYFDLLEAQFVPDGLVSATRYSWLQRELDESWHAAFGQTVFGEYRAQDADEQAELDESRQYILGRLRSRGVMP